MKLADHLRDVNEKYSITEEVYVELFTRRDFTDVYGKPIQEETWERALEILHHEDTEIWSFIEDKIARAIDAAVEGR